MFAHIIGEHILTVNTLLKNFVAELTALFLNHPRPLAKHKDHLAHRGGFCSERLISGIVDYIIIPKNQRGNPLISGHNQNYVPSLKDRIQKQALFSPQK